MDRACQFSHERVASTRFESRRSNPATRSRLSFGGKIVDRRKSSVGSRQRFSNRSDTAGDNSRNGGVSQCKIEVFSVDPLRLEPDDFVSAFGEPDGVLLVVRVRGSPKCDVLEKSDSRRLEFAITEQPTHCRA